MNLDEIIRRPNGDQTSIKRFFTLLRLVLKQLEEDHDVFGYSRHFRNIRDHMEILEGEEQ